MLEYCRLSSFTVKSIWAADENDLTFSCRFGTLKMIYGSTDSHRYILQEITLSGDKRADFLREILNSTLDQLDEKFREDNPGDFYQASMTYVNPALPDIYAEHADAFIDTVKTLGCTGELPYDFMEQSKYRAEITVSE